MGAYSDFFRSVHDGGRMGGGSGEAQEEDVDSSVEEEGMPQANLAESRGSGTALNEVDWQIGSSIVELAKMVARLVRLVSLARRTLSPETVARVAGLQAAAQAVAASLRRVEVRGGELGESAALRRDFARALGRIVDRPRPRLSRGAAGVTEGVWSRFLNPRPRYTPEQVVALACRLLHDLLRGQETALRAQIAQTAAVLELDRVEASTLGEAVGDIILVLGRQAKGAPGDA